MRDNQRCADAGFHVATDARAADVEVFQLAQRALVAVPARNMCEAGLKAGLAVAFEGAAVAKFRGLVEPLVAYSVAIDVSSLTMLERQS